MGKAIAHRGPDGEGFLVEPGVGLVHRRLSIIDLAGGSQPLGNEDGSVQVVFNGEIYNYQELRRDLESRGHRFRTQSDTEVLVHLYEEEGDSLVRRLRGMFAFAIWDRSNRSLLLARDRLGIKPLYLYRDSEHLVFGSELKAILACSDIERRIDPEALESYLAYGVVTGSRSIFARIERLLPAHTLRVGLGNWDRPSRCYWRLEVEPDESRTVEDWQDELIAKFDESVRLHRLADVPVGAFLSGGIDSSAIVASCSTSSGEPIQTFSIGFGERKFSELPVARETANQFGTIHTEEIATPVAADLLDELSYYYDEPFADSSALPTFLVSRLASRHVKVVLSGDGGDECFGGYARYAQDIKEGMIRRKVPGWLRRSVVRPLGAAWPRLDWLPRPLRIKSALTNIAEDGGTAYANTLSICRPPLRRQLMAAPLRASLNGHDPRRLIREAYSSAPAHDDLAGMISADVSTILPDDFLVKVDRASMACGLEVRPPLLDHELMELSARIPSRWKVHRGETKWIFKEAVRNRLPSTLLNRPKQGFEIPVDAWLRGPLREMVEGTVLDPGSRISSLIDPTAAKRLYQAHLSGRGHHGSVLWSLLVLARWSDRHLANGSSKAH
jgi:asparagine synthase (glutamine-hydrolysing)